MKTAIIYVRVSDKKQVEKNLSIPGQVEACEAHAHKLDLNVVKIFIEEGKSAWYGHRPEFEDAITYCEVNEINYFITWDTARFSRDHVNGPLSRYRLRSAGTKIEYLTVDIDPETDGGFILETVYQLTDELKSRKTSADTKRSMIKNAKSGYFNGGKPPFGFKVVPSLADEKRKVLQKDMQESPIVKKIFELRAKGFGSKTIAITLNNDDLSNRGRRWSKATISALLRNHAVIGKTVFNKKDRKNKRTRKKEDWIIVESHEPIINIDVWENVQILMNEAVPVLGASSPKSTRLFTGMLKCGKCSASMQTETAKGRSQRYFYYNCRNKQKDNLCEGHRVRADHIDDFLLEQIAEKIFKKNILIGIAKELKTVSGTWHTQQRIKINTINSKLLTVQNKRKKIYQLLEDSDPEELNLADVKPRLLEHNSKIKEFESQLNAITTEKPPQIPILSNDLEDLLSVCKGFILDPNKIKEARGFLSGFIDKIEVNDETVRIHYKPEHLLAFVSSEPVHSEERWLPEHSLLGTIRLKLDLPSKLCKVA